MHSECSDTGQAEVLAHLHAEAVDPRDDDLSLLQALLRFTADDVELPRVEVFIDAVSVRRRFRRFRLVFRIHADKVMARSGDPGDGGCGRTNTQLDPEITAY